MFLNNISGMECAAFLLVPYTLSLSTVLFVTSLSNKILPVTSDPIQLPLPETAESKFMISEHAPVPLDFSRHSSDCPSLLEPRFFFPNESVTCKENTDYSK